MPIQSVAAQSQADASRSDSEEVAALRAQLEEMRQFRSDLLQTVYWALGTIAAVAAVLVTYNFFQMRVSEQDARRAAKDEIRSDVMAVLDERMADWEKRQKSREKAYIEAIAKRLNDQTNKNDRWHSQTGAEFDRRLNDQLALNRAYSDLSSELVDSKFLTLDRNLKKLQFDLFRDSIRAAISQAASKHVSS